MKKMFKLFLILTLFGQIINIDAQKKLKRHLDYPEYPYPEYSYPEYPCPRSYPYPVHQYPYSDHYICSEYPEYPEYPYQEYPELGAKEKKQTRSKQLKKSPDAY